MAEGEPVKKESQRATETDNRTLAHHAQRDDGHAPPQLFLGDIDEEKRLSLAGFKSDEYFDAGGWKGDWGGVVAPEAEPFMKPVSLALRQLWKLIGHRAYKMFPHEPLKAMKWIERTMKDIIREASHYQWKERASFYESMYCYYVDAHGLGLKGKYQAHRDTLNPPSTPAKKDKDNGQG